MGSHAEGPRNHPGQEMQIKAKLEGERLTLTAEPSTQDLEFTANRKGKLGRKDATVWLPNVEQVDIHPDTLALAALLIFGPFAAKEISLGWAVSEKFATAVKANFRRSLGRVSADVAPRVAPSNGVDALAFSGGIDSVAALAIMPETTVPIFMHRRVPEDGKTGLYKADAALKSCADVEASGRKIFVIDTDMEFSRDPVGFAVDWTNAMGGVLLADVTGFRSVSFGMVQESAFFLGHHHYSDLAERSIYRAWAPLFEAIDLPIALPTAGLSEVMTSAIAQSVSHKWSAQSCVRGAVNKPCGRCFKCFRKRILDARLTGAELPAEHFDIAQYSPEVKRRLLEVPIHHEDVLAFSLQGLLCEPNPILDALQAKTASITAYAKGLDILRRYNPSVMRYLPPHLQEPVRKRLEEFCVPLNAEEQAIVEQWNLVPLVESHAYLQGQKTLEDALMGRQWMPKAMAPKSGET